MKVHEHAEKSPPLGGLMGLYCATSGQTRFNRRRLSLANSQEVKETRGKGDAL